MNNSSNDKIPTANFTRHMHAYLSHFPALWCCSKTSWCSFHVTLLWYHTINSILQNFAAKVAKLHRKHTKLPKITRKHENDMKATRRKCCKAKYWLWGESSELFTRIQATETRERRQQASAKQLNVCVSPNIFFKVTIHTKSRAP